MTRWWCYSAVTFFTTTLGGSSSENFECLNFDLLRIPKNRARRGAVPGDGLTGTWGRQLVATHFVKVG